MKQHLKTTNFKIIETNVVHLSETKVQIFVTLLKLWNTV